MKARECSPKRGYFYRSWVTVVNAVEMAKELELDEHYELHQMGRPCGSGIDDCIAKTRVWHMLFVMEMMIGGPQGESCSLLLSFLLSPAFFSHSLGRAKDMECCMLIPNTGRRDFKVDMDTLDFSDPRPLQGQDESEVQISRQLTYSMRLVRCMRYSTKALGKLKKKADWMNDPEFTQFNEAYASWPRDLPPDLQVDVSEDDDSIPYIPSHYIANMHSYHQLAVIMQHRPQLHYMMENYDDSWKEHMTICYNAAKKMCRLQEAVIHNHGLAGLLFMQRGISFTIYAVLTCTVLHLVCWYPSS